MNREDPSGYLSPTGWLIVAGAIVGGIYQLVYYFTHTPKSQRTFWKLLLNFLIGAVAGSITGLIISGKTGLVDGIAGALGAIVSYSIDVWKNHKSFSVWKLIQKAIGGFAAGAISGSFGTFMVDKLRKGWQVVKIVNSLVTGLLSAIIGEW